MSETSSASTPPARRETPNALSTNPGRAAPEKIAIPSLRGGSSRPVSYDPAQDRMGKNPLFERTDEDDGTVGLQGIHATAGHLAALRAKNDEAIANSGIAQQQYVSKEPTKTTTGMKEYAEAGGAGVTPTTNLGVPDPTAHPAAPESAKPPPSPVQRAIDARRAAGADAKPPTGTPKPPVAKPPAEAKKEEDPEPKDVSSAHENAVPSEAS